MSTTHLPQDIFTSKLEDLPPLIFHPYNSEVAYFKGRSILYKNAISLVSCGEKTIYFAEKTVKVNENEFHFLSSGNCLATMKLSPKKVFKSMLIFFDGSIFTDFKIKYQKLISTSISKFPEKQSYVSFRKDPFIDQFIKSLHTLFDTQRLVSMEMKLLKLEELLLYLLEKHPSLLLSFNTEKDNDEFIFKRAVETNLFNDISIEEFAFLNNMSISTFKRRFAELYGTSPQKWILTKRMEYAKELLVFRNEKPGEIYYKVGYGNHSSFSHAFRKHFGVTPSELLNTQAERITT